MNPEQIADKFIEYAGVVKPGETLVVEIMQPMRNTAERFMREALGRAAKSLGVSVLVLPYGMRAARIERKPEPVRDSEELDDGA